jgi:hypothetical protein
MALIFFILIVVAVCILGAKYGADSRHVEHGRHRPTLL